LSNLIYKKSTEYYKKGSFGKNGVLQGVLNKV
jgi:hypothetical protein